MFKNLQNAIATKGIHGGELIAMWLRHLITVRTLRSNPDRDVLTKPEKA